MEFVVLVRGIEIREDSSGEPFYCFKVSKYSFLASLMGSNEGLMNPKELVLHFSDFATMGESSDAEIILLESISTATSLSAKFDGLKANVVACQALQQEGMFTQYLYVQKSTHASGCDHNELICRFAIRRSNASLVSCITPLAPRLIRHSDRPKELKFDASKPAAVFDLTADVLGSAQGFTDAGFPVSLGIASRYEDAFTWKVSAFAQSCSVTHETRLATQKAHYTMATRSKFSETWNLGVSMCLVT